MNDSRRFRTWASGLLDQQLWCWGRDILRPEGNLLRKSGFCRTPAPDPKRDCSAYSAQTADGCDIRLWGFGVMSCHPQSGGLFLRRYRFEPKLLVRIPTGPIHRLDSIGPVRSPQGRSDETAVRILLDRLARWIAEYEHFVAETAGRDYREASVRARGKEPHVEPAKMAPAWEKLAKKAHRLCSSERPLPPAWGDLLRSLATRASAGGRTDRRPHPRLTLRSTVSGIRPR
jgi:hypothetical protein